MTCSECMGLKEQNLRFLSACQLVHFSLLLFSAVCAQLRAASRMQMCDEWEVLCRMTSSRTSAPCCPPESSWTSGLSARMRRGYGLFHDSSFVCACMHAIAFP